MEFVHRKTKTNFDFKLKKNFFKHCCQLKWIFFFPFPPSPWDMRNGITTILILTRQQRYKNHGRFLPWTIEVHLTEDVVKADYLTFGFISELFDNRKLDSWDDIMDGF